jgi:hypothetical protein
LVQENPEEAEGSGMNLDRHGDISDDRASNRVFRLSKSSLGHEFNRRLQHTQQAGVGYEHPPGLRLGFLVGQRCNAAFANSIAVWASARRRPFVQKIDEIVKAVQIPRPAQTDLYRNGRVSLNHPIPPSNDMDQPKRGCARIVADSEFPG